MPNCSSKHDEQFESMVGGALLKRTRSLGSNPHSQGRSRMTLKTYCDVLADKFIEERSPEINSTTKKNISMYLLKCYFINNDNGETPLSRYETIINEYRGYHSQPSGCELSQENVHELIEFFEKEHRGRSGIFIPDDDDDDNDGDGSAAEGAGGGGSNTPSTVILAPSSTDVTKGHYDLVQTPGGFKVVDTDDFFQIGEDGFGTQSPTMIQAISYSIVQKEYNRRLRVEKIAHYEPHISQLKEVLKFFYNNSNFIEKNTSPQFRQFACRCIKWACWLKEPNIMLKADALETMENESLILYGSLEKIVTKIQQKIPKDEIQSLLFESAKAIKDSTNIENISHTLNYLFDVFNKKMRGVESASINSIKELIRGAISTNALVPPTPTPTAAAAGPPTPGRGAGEERDKKTGGAPKRTTKKVKSKMLKGKSKKHLKKDKKSKKGKKTGKKVRFHSASKKSKKTTRKRR